MRSVIEIREVLFDMKNKSHQEAALVADPEQRYLIEAGTEKDDELIRCIINSVSVVRARCSRFLAGCEPVDCDNMPGLDAESRVTFLFGYSARRSPSAAKTVTDRIHSFMVDYSLALFYEGTKQADSAAVRRAEADRAIAEIEYLLYDKGAPQRPEIYD